jgi:hypothetical protein
LASAVLAEGLGMLAHVLDGEWKHRVTFAYPLSE